MHSNTHIFYRLYNLRIIQKGKIAAIVVHFTTLDSDFKDYFLT